MLNFMYVKLAGVEFSNTDPCLPSSILIQFVSSIESPGIHTVTSPLGSSAITEEGTLRLMGPAEQAVLFRE